MQHKWGLRCAEECNLLIEDFCIIGLQGCAKQWIRERVKGRYLVALECGKIEQWNGHLQVVIKNGEQSTLVLREGLVLGYLQKNSKLCGQVGRKFSPLPTNKG